MVLLKSPVSPSLWPVAIADAFAVVKVGNMEWVLANRTPRRSRFASVGVFRSSTIPGRMPSATNSTTL